MGCDLAAEGADLLDVGGESTRPGAAPVEADEELRRVMPVVERLCRQTDVPVSIDTSKAAVAREAIAAGAEVDQRRHGLDRRPGDAGGGGRDRLGRVRDAHAGHAARPCSRPRRTTTWSRRSCDYLAARRDALVAAGIDPARIALDPGIGFGKTTEHNLALLGERRAVSRAGLPAAGRALAQGVHRPGFGRSQGGPHRRHDRRRAGPGPPRRPDSPRPRRGGRARRPWCCSRPAGGWGASAVAVDIAAICRASFSRHAVPVSVDLRGLLGDTSDLSASGRTA